MFSKSSSLGSFPALLAAFLVVLAGQTTRLPAENDPPPEAGVDGKEKGEEPEKGATPKEEGQEKGGVARNQGRNIKANQIQFRQVDGKTVVMLQGDIYLVATEFRLKADYGEGHQNDQGQVLLGFATGNVRIFLEGAMLRGDRLDYDAGSEKLFLTADQDQPDPQAWRDGKVISSKQIVYDLKTKGELQVVFLGDVRGVDGTIPDEYYEEFPHAERKQPTEGANKEIKVPPPPPLEAQPLLPQPPVTQPPPEVKPLQPQPTVTQPPPPPKVKPSQPQPTVVQPPRAQPQQPARPESPKPSPQPSAVRVAPSLPLLPNLFETPGESADACGNPVRQGHDGQTKWPLEVRHKPTGMHLVFIPNGEFQMGSPENEKGRGADEGAPRKVVIPKAFYLGKYEVTQAEWKKVMVQEPWSGKDKAKANPQHAAGWLSWKACQKFVEKLNQGLRDSKGMRFFLPMESQWEYACRAGSTSRFYYGDDPGSSELGDHAWYVRNAEAPGDRYPHPVGKKKPNAWSLYDMEGNVWEWCEDAWIDQAADLPGEGGNTDVIDAGEAGRVLRGGSWSCPAHHCRSAFRYWGVPALDWHSHGVRVVLREP